MYSKEYKPRKLPQDEWRNHVCQSFEFQFPAFYF